jgi:hypothetical protein
LPSERIAATTQWAHVEVVRARCHWKRDNYSEDKKYVLIKMKNTGTQPTGFDLFQSWID